MGGKKVLRRTLLNLTLLLTVSVVYALCVLEFYSNLFIYLAYMYVFYELRIFVSY